MLKSDGAEAGPGPDFRREIRREIRLGNPSKPVADPELEENPDQVHTASINSLLSDRVACEERRYPSLACAALLLPFAPLPPALPRRTQIPREQSALS